MVVLYPLVRTLWTSPVDNSRNSRTGGRTGGRNSRNGYFHCVETPNPAAMKPKPTTMFQLPSASTGSEPSVT
ncbi:hypothetical protein OK074_7808 [Actinobacteria bacterium OK074]|nr:hypothetical protein OK074_7808 [Actinobacteria bacterium OK074]